MKYIFSRLKEPSTWAGIAAIAAALLPIIGVPAAAVAAAVSALGGVAVLVRDPAGTAKE